MRHPYWAMALVGACCALQFSAARAAEYSVAQITVPNITQIFAGAINDHGDVVGSFYAEGNDYLTPFIYRGGQVTDLTARFALPSLYDDFTPIDVNNSGQVLMRKFCCSQGLLFDVNSGDTTSIYGGAVNSLNSAGDVAGNFTYRKYNVLAASSNADKRSDSSIQWSNLDYSDTAAGFVYSNGQLSPIPGVASKPAESTVVATNKMGQAVGMATIDLDPGAYRGSFWPEAYFFDGTQTISLNPYKGDRPDWLMQVTVKGIRDDGVVYGEASGSKSTSQMPFEYRNGEFKALGLPEGALSSTIVAGNEQGQYLVSSFDGTKSSYDLYDQGAWQDLTLPALEGKVSIYDINNHGQLLGVLKPPNRFGATSVLVLTPVVGAVPEPASVMLWALGLFGVAFRHRSVLLRARH